METNRVEIKKAETKRMKPDLKLINMEMVEVEQIEWLIRLSLLEKLQLYREIREKERPLWCFRLLQN